MNKKCDGQVDQVAAVKHIKELMRMTKDCAIPCEECPLNALQNGMNMGCHELKKTHPEKEVEIVMKWAKEHPKKTFLDDVKEKLPDIDTNKGDGYEYPLVCRKRLYAKDGEKLCVKKLLQMLERRIYGGVKLNNLEKLKELVKRGIGSSVSKHLAIRLAEQIACFLHNEGIKAADKD